MATAPSEFVTLAAELIGDEFAAFSKNAIITQATAWDNATQTYTEQSQTIPMIRLDFMLSQFDGNLVQIGDYKLVGEYADLSWEPTPDNATLTHDGISLIVKDFKKDAADASFYLHVRRL